MAEPQKPGWGKQEVEGLNMEDVAVSSAKQEPSTLQWPGGKDRGDESVSPSLKGRESRTESERELGGRGSRADGGWPEGDKAREAGMSDGASAGHFLLEGAENEGDMANWMPEKAAQVFSPQVKILCPSGKYESPAESATLRVSGTEKSPLLGPQGTPPDAYYHDWSGEANPSKCACCSGDQDVLKLAASVFAAAIIFPFLVLVYTLRCSIFAAVPIVLGVLVLGVSRLRFSSVKPLYDGGAESREVSVHWRYISDSLSLFLLYFLQLAVMATYLSQEQLKVVPLLTIVFAFGRLVYWVSVAMGSSIRGVGFGLSFLPILAMLGANLYFVFTLDGGGGIFALQPPTTPAPPRMRWWG
ncbi:hypothetical protein AGOR_G00034850 [Albula goreensis]|uniref:Transmembrane protein 79 n=1 Tax=Albula goreensis TaxID=1534307 RepID=A0A8T3E3L9_9TELE|nr:hypothetical protein AGOR_G00034850 [Albula goreensis]